MARRTIPGILLLDPTAYERDGRDNDADGTIDEPGEDYLNPVRVLFESDNIDNDFDGTVDEAGEFIDLRHASDTLDPILEGDGIDNDLDGLIDEPDEDPPGPVSHPTRRRWIREFPKW